MDAFLTIKHVEDQIKANPSLHELFKKCIDIECPLPKVMTPQERIAAVQASAGIFTRKIDGKPITEDEAGEIVRGIGILNTKVRILSDILNAWVADESAPGPFEPIATARLTQHRPS